MELISRQAAIEAFNTNIDELVVSGKENADAVERYINRVLDAIKQLPPIQPKRGRWEMGMDECFVECSKCGLMTTRNELRGIAVFGKNEPNFCPNCGADMREVTT